MGLDCTYMSLLMRNILTLTLTLTVYGFISLTVKQINTVYILNRETGILIILVRVRDDSLHQARPLWGD